MLIDKGGKMMKKGITPIIAVIILLLITVALAGFAWSFLSGYIGGLTGKNVQVADSYCAGGTSAIMIIRNTGTESLNIGTAPIGCTAVLPDTNERTCGDVTITRTDTGGLMDSALNLAGVIPQQGAFKLTDTGCTQTGSAKICTYRIRAPGGMGPNIISVSCSG